MISVDNGYPRTHRTVKLEHSRKGTMSRYKINFKDMPWVAPAAGVRMKVHTDGATQVRLVEFSREFVEADWCTRGHVGTVLDGRLEVDFNGTPEVLEAGDGVLIPEGEEHKHKAKVLTDKVTLILIEAVAEASDRGDA